jgi:hypothetical protein
MGHWYGSPTVDSEVRESQPLNIFSELSQIMGSWPVKTMSGFRFEPGCRNSELLTNHFSLMSVFCVFSSDGTEDQRKFIFCMENVESHHPMSKSVVSSADGTENQTISTDSMEIGLHISQPYVLSRENTEAQPISTHPVQPVEI